MLTKNVVSVADLIRFNTIYW